MVRAILTTARRLALKIASYGVMGLVQRNPPLVALFYLLPLLGAGSAIALLAGYSPNALATRFRMRAA